MRLGIALSDEDRWPWLERLRELIERTVATKENAVLACSALKKSYREFLRVSKEVKFVYLRGDHELIAKQIGRRRDHFMNPELLPSQFAALEEPGSGEDVIVVDLGRAPRALVRGIEEKLHLI
jgi:gluconokinase